MGDKNICQLLERSGTRPAAFHNFLMLTAVALKALHYFAHKLFHKVAGALPMLTYNIREQGRKSWYLK